MGSGYWAGEAIAQSMQNNIDRANANAELAKAQRWHSGTIAQLSACLREIERLDPVNPLLRQKVLDVIDADGEKSYRRTRRLQAAWQLDHEPQRILQQLTDAHAAERASLLERVSSEPIAVKMKSLFFIFKRREVYIFMKTVHGNISDARQHKALVIEKISATTLDDSPLSLDALNKSAMEKLKLQAS